MSTRRTCRSGASSSSISSIRAQVRPSVRRGIESIVEGNESYIAKLLSLKVDGETTIKNIADELEQCMGMNNLTAEMLLATFFDVSILSRYSQCALKKSGKGSAATLAARITKEWSKTDFQSSSAKRKRGEGDGNDTRREYTKTSQKIEIKESEIQKGDSINHEEEEEEEEEEEDWKRTLFYWKGRLIHDPHKNTLRWDGSWVSGLAEDGLPGGKDFETQKDSSSFKLSNAGKLVTDSKAELEDAETKGPLQYLVGLSGRFKGSYLLDQDDGRGPQKFKDIAHHFAFDSCRNSTTNKDGGVENEDVVLAAATGTTEFGRFVSLGYAKVCCDASEETELILARRYIDEDDSRAAWTKKKTQMQTKSLLGTFLKETSSFIPHGKIFWAQSLPRKS